MSLDGIHSRTERRIGLGSSWIRSIDFTALFSQFDTVLVGRRTFEPMAHAGACDDAWHEDGGGVDYAPPRRTFRTSLSLGRMFTNTWPRSRASSGKDIWLFGGGELFRGLLDGRPRGRGRGRGHPRVVGRRHSAPSSPFEAGRSSVHWAPCLSDGDRRPGGTHKDGCLTSRRRAADSPLERDQRTLAWCSQVRDWRARWRWQNVILAPAWHGRVEPAVDDSRDLVVFFSIISM